MDPVAVELKSLNQTLRAGVRQLELLNELLRKALSVPTFVSCEPPSTESTTNEPDPSTPNVEG